jgi:anti-sigma-K factor RskA
MLAGMSDNPDHIPDGSDDDALAAEYVLGVLDVGERDTVTARIDSDAVFAALVEAWTAHFTAFNDEFQPVTPPVASKEALKSRLFADEMQPTHWWNSLAIWRGVALASLVALVIVVTSVTQQPGEVGQPQTYVSSLQSDGSDARFVVIYTADAQHLSVTRLAGDLPANSEFELWLIEGGNPPQSLGVIASGDATTNIQTTLAQKMDAGVILAVSIEPLGGSTAQGPSGPVVAAGAVFVQG